MKPRTLFLAAVLSLGLSAAVFAQMTTVEGTVVSQSSTTLVLNTTNGQQTFMVDGQSSLPAGLTTGQRVTVEYQTGSDNQPHAMKVSAATGSSSSASSADTSTSPDNSGSTAAAATGNTTANANPTASNTDTTGRDTSSDMTGTATTAPSATTPSTTTGSTTGNASAGQTTGTTGTTSSMGTSSSTGTTSETTTETTTTQTTDTTTSGSRRLPATATPLPLLALVGTLAVIAGLLVRRRYA